MVRLNVARVPSPLPELPPCLCASGFYSPTTHTALGDPCGISDAAAAVSVQVTNSINKASHFTLKKNRLLERGSTEFILSGKLPQAVANASEELPCFQMTCLCEQLFQSIIDDFNTQAQGQTLLQSVFSFSRA